MEEIRLSAEERDVINGLWEKVRQAADGEGCKCPVCGLVAKVYNRNISEMMARFLIWLYNMYFAKGPEFIDYKEFGEGLRNPDYAKLRLWGLTESLDHKPGDEGKRTSGKWRITALGRAFVLGEVTVPKNVRVYNNTVVGRSEEQINIEQTFGKRFDYVETITGIPRPAKPKPGQTKGADFL